jgi:hypothetical protein
LSIEKKDKKLFKIKKIIVKERIWKTVDFVGQCADTFFSCFISRSRFVSLPLLLRFSHTKGKSWNVVFRQCVGDGKIGE